MKNKMSKGSLITKLVIDAILVAFLLVIILRKNIFPGDSIVYNMYDPNYAMNAWVIVLKTLVIVIGCILVMQISNLLLLLPEKIKNNSAKTALLLIANLVKYGAAIAMVIMCLAAWGVDTTTLVTASGVLALIIGLGCQTLVSDVVSGIFMLFEGDIKVGDIVVVNGWRGTVQQIGLRRTKIIDAVGNINFVNNSSISSIINNTQALSVAVIEVGTEYNESIQRIEEVIAKGLPEMKKNIPAIVNGPYYKGVSALGESSVNIKLVAECKEEDKYQVERDMNREIKMLFDKYQIGIPFNQVVVNYRDPNEGDKTQYKGSQKKNGEFIAEQKAASKGIEEQDKE